MERLRKISGACKAALEVLKSPTKLDRKDPDLDQDSGSELNGSETQEVNTQSQEVDDEHIASSQNRSRRTRKAPNKFMDERFDEPQTGRKRNSQPANKVIKSKTRNQTQSNQVEQVVKDPLPCCACGEISSLTLTCIRCHGAICCQCMGISESQYSFQASLTKSGMLPTCKKCLDKTMKAAHEDFTVEQRCENYTAKINNRLINLEKLVQSKVDVSSLKSAVKEAVDKNVVAAVQERLTTEVDDAVKEADLRKEKKDNLIIFHLPESEYATGEDRQADDLEQVNKLLSNNMGLDTDSFAIAELIRLGPKKDNSPRPVRMKIMEERTRLMILKASNTLKDLEDKTLKKIFMVRDLTQKQRKEAQKLRAERKVKQVEAEAQGDTANEWKIRRGKLIQVPKTVQDAPVDSSASQTAGQEEL